MPSRLRFPRTTATRHQRLSPTPKPSSLSSSCLLFLCLILLLLVVSIWASSLLRDRRGEPRPQLRGRRFSSEKKEANMMSLQIVDTTFADFEQTFEKFKSENDSPDCPKFLLFLADRDPATNLTWCPDCNRAEPIIYEKLEASKNDVALLRAYVGDRPTWRNPSHPWRTDPRFNLDGVPTLIRWEKEMIIGRLEDHEAHLGSKIDALLAIN